MNRYGIDTMVKITAAVVAVFLLAFVASPALAQDNRLPGRKMISAEPVDPVAARNVLAARAVPTLYAPPVAPAPAEIRELARGLKNDPDLIFAYVHDAVQYEPGYGSVKGALGALRDGRGNAFDQAELMVALLRATGHPASFLHGSIRLTGEQASNWLGVADDVNAVNGLLGAAGIPAVVSPAVGPGPVAYVDLDHIWVKVQIDGVAFVFDPAFKSHEVSAGIDFVSAMGYDRSAFLAAAGGTAHEAPDAAMDDYSYVEGLSRDGVRAALQNYATTLINHIQQTAPTAAINDVVGGRTIVPVTGQVRQASLPYQLAADEEWADIPDQYRTLLRVRYGDFDLWFRSGDVYGRRLSLLPAGDGSELHLDGLPVGSGWNAYVLYLEVDHPYAAADDTGTPGTYGDQQGRVYGVDGAKVSILTAFGQMGRGMIERHRTLAKEIRHSGASGEPVWGETLALIGYNYAAQMAQADRLAARVGGAMALNHHTVGAVMQKTFSTGENLLMDLAVCRSSQVSLDGVPDRALPGFLAYADRASVLESGVVEQTQGFGAVSATKALDLAAASGQRIVKATPENWNHILTTLDLDNTAPGLSDQVEPIVYGQIPYQAIVPVGNELTQNAWTGRGLVTAAITPEGGTDWTNVVHMSEGRKGATCADLECAADEIEANKKPTFCPIDLVKEPIDMADGRFLHNFNDLTVGNGANALTFSRSYYSSNRLDDSGLGYGWGHNHSASIAFNTDGFQGLGEWSPMKAAAAVAAFYAAQDVLAENRDLDRLVISAIAHTWLMEQLTRNVVTISFPGGSKQFFKYPDGHYGGQSCCSGDDLAVQGDGSFLVSTKSGMKYAFTADGKFSVQTDPKGNTVNYTYGSDGRLTSVSNSFGRSITLTWTDGRVTSVSGGGASVSYAYDAQGRLVSSTDPAGNPTTFAYDDKNRLTRFYNPSDTETPFVENTYDDLDRAATQSIAGRPAATYYFGGIRSEEIDALGNSTVWHYPGDWYFDRSKTATAKVDALGRVTRYEHDGRMRVVRTVYPEGNALEYAYDADDNILTATLVDKTGANRLTTSFTYEPNFNKPATITDPLGRVTGFAYDAKGNLTEIRQPAVGGTTPITTFAYDSRGMLLSKTAPDGTLTAYTYNSSSDLTSVTADAGHLALTTTFAYDAAGNVVSVTDPLGAATTMTYDAARRLAGTIAPNPFSYATNFGYDADGNLASVTRQGPPVQTVSSTYSLTGEKLTDVSPEGHPTVYAYDDLDRLTTATDAEGRTTRYVYDALGRLLQVIDGNGRAEQTYTYTQSGQIHTIKDANNNVTTYSYDGFDRLVATTYPDGSTETLTLDDAGRVLAVNTRAGQTITYAYDALDRLTQKNIPGGGQYTYAYDPANRIVNATGPGGPIQHAYDTAGRLLNVTYPGGQQVAYAYDAASRRTKLSYPDGREVYYQYDQLGRLTAVNQDPDGAGELPAALAAGYTYDALSRRTRLTNGNNTLTDYAYSLDGNVLSIAHQWAGDAATLNYTYDRTGLQTGYASNNDRFATLFNALGTATNAPNNLNQYTTAAGQSLTYDQNGNLTGDGARTFTYDAANRLITAQAAQAATYAYDPFDRRGIKTVDGQTTTYIYDGDEVIAEYDGAGLARKFVLGPGIDQPILMEAGTNRYFYHANTLGSVIALTGTTGGVEETYQYSVYGEVSQTSNLGNPYLFTGRSLDPETGLYYYRARYYDADLGRFLQPDPIGFAGGMNLYAYVGNGPTYRGDPFGLWFEPESGRLGIEAHKVFTRHVTSQSSNYRGNRAFSTIFGANDLDRPDLIDLSSGYLWELKPISHREDKAQRRRDQRQVYTYVAKANIYGKPNTFYRPADSAHLITEGESAGYFTYNDSTYEVLLYNGFDVGMIYYKLRKTEPEPVKINISELEPWQQALMMALWLTLILIPPFGCPG